MEGMLGRKVGMTQVFADDGNAIPVTVVAAGPCLVVQRKTVDKDGYEAVQLDGRTLQTSFGQPHAAPEGVRRRGG